MVSIDSAKSRRLDGIMASAYVLTVNALVLLGIAVVGVPFLAFFFSDENGTWQRLWPLVAAWFAAAALGAANAVTMVRFARHPADPPRPADAAVVLSTAVAATVLTASVSSSTALVLLAAALALANAAAAWVLFGAVGSAAPVRSTADGARIAPDEASPGAAAETSPAAASETGSAAAAETSPAAASETSSDIASETSFGALAGSGVPGSSEGGSGEPDNFTAADVAGDLSIRARPTEEIAVGDRPAVRSARALPPAAPTFRTGGATQVRSAGRRLRARAAMHSLGGVQLSRRARAVR